MTDASIIEPTDQETARQAETLLDILADTPSMGVVLANATVALSAILSIAYEAMKTDQDHPMANAVLTAAGEFGIVAFTPSATDPDSGTLANSEDFNDAIEVLAEAFGSEETVQ